MYLHEGKRYHAHERASESLPSGQVALRLKE